jgi:hypothetical protein
MKVRAPAASWAGLRADLAAMSDADLRKLWRSRFAPYVRPENSELVEMFMRTGDAAELNDARRLLDAGLHDKENAASPMPLPSVTGRSHGPMRTAAPWKVAVLAVVLLLPCCWVGLWLWGTAGSDFRLLALAGFLAVLFAEFFAALGVFRIVERIKGHKRR